MERKTVWLWNHYATNMFSDKGGRHHWFGKFLMKKGYDVKIFCASTIHNSDREVDTGGELFRADVSEGIEYVFVKTPQYSGSGKARIKNMYAFYKGAKKAALEIGKRDGKPMAIVASSVHPLTLMAGESTAKKLDVPCICEVRDLWPETLVSLGIVKRKSPVAKVMYAGEKRIYQKADKLIFTVPGGADYLKDRGWDKGIDLKDVYNINNGVDLESFIWQRDNTVYEDPDLDGGGFKVLYTGAVRMVNQVMDLVKAGEVCKERGYEDIKFIIIGDGDDRTEIAEYIEAKGLDNIVLKDRVARTFIPSILSKGDINVVTVRESDIFRYGVSWNKLFEYMASGKPVIANEDISYNFIDEYGFGICRRFKNREEFADEIIKLYEDREKYGEMSKNALRAAEDFDYKKLTDRLEEVIKEALEDRQNGKV